MITWSIYDNLSTPYTSFRFHCSTHHPETTLNPELDSFRISQSASVDVSGKMADSKVRKPFVIFTVHISCVCYLLHSKELLLTFSKFVGMVNLSFLVKIKNFSVVLVDGTLEFTNLP